MRHLALAGSGLLAGVLLAASVAADPPPGGPEQEVVAAIKARIDAFNRRDIKAFRGAAAENYLGVNEDGAVVTEVPDYSSLPRDYSQISDIRDVFVRVHGDTAAANYRTTEREPSGGGIVLVTEERRSEAWQKQEGRWRLLQAHLSSIPVNFRTPVPLDVRRLPDYPGTYELRPGEQAHVTVDAVHLFVGFDKDAPWEASYGGGDTFFFRQMQGDLMSYVFERDAQKRVVALLLQRPDGQTIRAPRRP